MSRTSTRSRVFAAVATGALTLVLPAASAPVASNANARFPRPHILLRVPIAEGFAQDGPRIAWADSSQPCQRRVQLRDLRTRRTTPLTSRSGPTCLSPMAGFQHRMALAGHRALWGGVWGSLSSYHVDLQTASLSSRERSLGAIHTDRNVSEEPPYETPFQPVPMAGDGDTLVYGFIGNTEEQYPAGVFRVGAKHVLVPGTSRPLAVAAHGTAFAVARTVLGGCICNSQPVWSPDGTRIAFLGRSRTRELPDAYVVDVDGKAVRLLGRSGHPEWSPDGRLLALAAGPGILIVTADGKRLASISGEFAGWARDGRFAYWTRDRLAVRTVESAPLILSAKNVSYGTARWSPDGTSLLFLQALSNYAGYVVWVVDSRGGDARSLAPVSDNEPPLWSPDGKHIAFFSRPKRAVEAIEVATGRRRSVGRAATRFVGWSADGSRLAYIQDYSTLASVALDGTDSRVLARNVRDASWSPTRNELLVLREGTLHLVRTDGAEHALGRGIEASWEASWSRDGDRIAFTLGGEVAIARRDGTAHTMLTKTTPQPERRPVEVRSSGTGRLTVSFDVAPHVVTAVALDAARIAMILGRPNGSKLLEIRTRRGTLVRRLRVARKADADLGLSGRWVVYRVGTTIRAVDLRSGADRLLTIAGGTVVGLSIDVRRVAWGEQLDGNDNDVIRAVTLPA